MSEPNVITISLNPSLDRTLVVHYLAVGYHNRARETTRLNPAGKGVNIARALHQLNCPTRAIVLLGDDATSKAFKLNHRRRGLWHNGHYRFRQYAQQHLHSG
jgi:fructose-1-phosphate kinase PfkB-like protein